MTPRRSDGARRLASDAGRCQPSATPRVRSVNGRRISGDRNGNVPALVGVAPDRELPDSRFQYLVGMKARVLPQHRMRERSDQRLRRMAKLKMPRHKPCRAINLSLAIKCVEQSNPDRLLIGRQIVEPLAILTRNMGWRHVR